MRDSFVVPRPAAFDVVKVERLLAPYRLPADMADGSPGPDLASRLPSLALVVGAVSLAAFCGRHVLTTGARG